MAVAVTLHSLRYYGVLFDVWVGIDAKLRAVVTEVPIQALTHMLLGPIALAVGTLQFFPRLRARRPHVHRWLGRIYVAACLIAGAGALATAPFASGGPIAGLGFGILALLWIGTTLAAWRAATTRSFERHRILMRFSYALTFAAVTLRLQIPIGFALGYPDYSAMSVWLAYTSWIPNVVAVGLFCAVEQLRRISTRGVVSSFELQPPRLKATN
jgi:hypothetical protein